MNELALSKVRLLDGYWYTPTESRGSGNGPSSHGKAYLDNKCYEQAIDHLTLALKKNSKLTELKDSILYHSMLLTTLSKCNY